jgi:hypothetical protein
MNYLKVEKSRCRCFWNSNTNVTLGMEHRFQISMKDMLENPFGNLKFESSDPNAPAARAGKAQNFMNKIFKDLG